MKKLKMLYEKSELWFAIGLIVIYSVGQSLAVSLNAGIGVGYAANLILCVALTAFLLIFIRKNGLTAKYKLRASPVSAKRFLWYIPLAVIVSHNLWNGAMVRLPVPDLLCYLGYMLCVGIVEEILFRGMLFEAIAKDNVKSAIVISSVTFGLGHILNLLNGVHENLMDGVYQVVLAVAIGFLFVVIYYRGGSILPCIAAHSAIDMLSAFSSDAGMTQEKQLISAAVFLVIIIAYTVVLIKTLPLTSSAGGTEHELRIRASKKDRP